MAMAFDRSVGPVGASPRVGFWTAVVAGAFVAAALSSILLSFGIGVGLSVASTSPTWRDTSVALVLLSGFYLILQALVSFAAGGYVAGRLSFGSDVVLGPSPEVIPAAYPQDTNLNRSAVSAPLSELNQRDGFL